MTNVLITGATGNVGTAVIQSLQNIDHNLTVFAGIRVPESANDGSTLNNVVEIRFDFLDSSTHNEALVGCDILFLLRPPHISDVQVYFAPIISMCKVKAVKHIVFLSVQGADKSKMIPHHKIERLIVDSGIPYTFIRPAYFMQNFITTLHKDLVDKNRVFVPAGNARFTVIDVRDIGAVAARILSDVSSHINVAYDLTNRERLTFQVMTDIMNKTLRSNIRYVSPNLINFFIAKRRENMPAMMILVMIMLHYFPRFQKEPEVSDMVEIITQKQPISFQQFVTDHSAALISDCSTLRS